MGSCAPPEDVHFSHCSEYRPVPGKGRGLIALRPLPAGAVICCERPLLTFPSVTHAVFSRGELVTELVPVCERLVADLEPSVLQEVLALHCPDHLDDIVKEFPGDTMRRVLKVLLANGLIGETEDDLPDSAKTVDLFPGIARINHSCSPNVLPCERRGEWVSTRALRDIEEGEELLSSYILHLAPASSRRAALAAPPWSFDCCCGACRSGEGEDGARTALGVAKQEQELVAVLGRGSSRSQEELWVLLVQELELLDMAGQVKEAATTELPRLLANCFMLLKLVKRGEGGQVEERVIRDISDVFGSSFNCDDLREEAFEVSRILGSNCVEMNQSRFKLIDDIVMSNNDS